MIFYPPRSMLYAGGESTQVSGAADDVNLSVVKVKRQTDVYVGQMFANQIRNDRRRQSIETRDARLPTGLLDGEKGTIGTKTMKY